MKFDTVILQAQYVKNRDFTTYNLKDPPSDYFFEIYLSSSNQT